MKSADRFAIEFGLPKASEADDMARLLGEVFSQRDPPAVAVGATAVEFEEFARLLCPKAVTDELTIVARRGDTGNLVGVMLTEDCTSAMPAGIDRISRKFDPILDILGQLGTEYWSERQVAPGEAMHFFLLGVSNEVAGMGIAQRMVADGLELGARKGYRIAVTEATNKTSQHVFRKQGFVERVQRSYANHRFEGRSWFASIADQGGPMLMDRQLSSP